MKLHRKNLQPTFTLFSNTIEELGLDAEDITAAFVNVLASIKNSQ